MSILLEIQDMPGEIYDIDWEAGAREFIQENPGMEWDDYADWVEQVYGIQCNGDMEERINEIIQEESEPSDLDMQQAFGTAWHDGI